MFSFSTIELQKVKVQLEQELFERVVPFWERHSLDITYGGYFNCLDKTDLFMILPTHMATRRQVWMFAKLYESVQMSKNGWILHDQELNFYVSMRKRKAIGSILLRIDKEEETNSTKDIFRVFLCNGPESIR